MLGANRTCGTYDNHTGNQMQAARCFLGDFLGARAWAPEAELAALHGASSPRRSLGRESNENCTGALPRARRGRRARRPRRPASPPSSRRARTRSSSSRTPCTCSTTTATRRSTSRTTCSRRSCRSSRARRCRTSSQRGRRRDGPKMREAASAVPAIAKQAGFAARGVLVPNPYFAHVGEWRRCAAWQKRSPRGPRATRAFWRGSVKPGCNPATSRRPPRSPSRPRATTSSTSAPRRSTRPILTRAPASRRRCARSPRIRRRPRRVRQRVRLRSLAPIPQPPGDHGRVVLAQPQLALAERGAAPWDSPARGYYPGLSGATHGVVGRDFNAAVGTRRLNATRASSPCSYDIASRRSSGGEHHSSAPSFWPRVSEVCISRDDRGRAGGRARRRPRRRGSRGPASPRRRRHFSRVRLGRRTRALLAPRRRGLKRALPRGGSPRRRPPSRDRAPSRPVPASAASASTAGPSTTTPRARAIRSPRNSGAPHPLSPLV